MDIRDYIKMSIDFDKRRLSKYQSRFQEIKVSGRLCSRIVGGVRRYYHVTPTKKKEKYLNKSQYKTVIDLQRKRLYETIIPILKRNIAIKEELCSRLRDSSEAAVIEQLPVSYRPAKAFAKEAIKNKSKKAFQQSENPYRREDLKIETSFGLFVRTKGELAIAEFLYSLGVTFYYEKALRIRVYRLENGRQVSYIKEYYPDFTIILPDGRTMYWEHKGMLSDPQYVQRDLQKQIDYNMNGIFQPHNLLVTEEGPNNEIDMEAISRVIAGWLLPAL